MSASSYKIFNLNLFLCALSHASILVFSHIFEPLSHLKYMKIRNKVLLQSFRYGKYLSSLTLVTVVGLSNFKIIAKFFSSFFLNFSRVSFEHEQKPKLVFLEAE